MIEDQPAPIPNTTKPVWELVIEDMHERDHVGRERYGTPLQVENGRDHLIDAYQEALDLVVYLRAEIERRSIPGAEALVPNDTIEGLMVDPMVEQVRYLPGVALNEKSVRHIVEPRGGG